jgi:hypothetical protein
MATEAPPAAVQHSSPHPRQAGMVSEGRGTVKGGLGAGSRDKGRCLGGPLCPLGVAARSKENGADEGEDRRLQKGRSSAGEG